MSRQISTLKDTACQVVVQGILNQREDTSKEISEYIIRQLKTDRYTAVSEGILKRVVSCFPEKVTNDILRGAVAPHLREIKLKGCQNISASALQDIYERCKYLRSLELSECEQLLRASFFRMTGALTTNISVLNLSNSSSITDHGVRTILSTLKNLRHLNLSECTNLTDEMFLLDTAHQYSMEKHSEVLGPAGRKYLCELISVDVSMCQRLSTDAARHLCSLSGPTLQSVNLAYTDMDSSILWSLSGYALGSAVDSPVDVDDYHLDAVLEEKLFEDSDDEQEKAISRIEYAKRCASRGAVDAGNTEDDAEVNSEREEEKNPREKENSPREEDGDGVYVDDVDELAKSMDFDCSEFVKPADAEDLSVFENKEFYERLDQDFAASMITSARLPNRLTASGDENVQTVDDKSDLSGAKEDIESLFERTQHELKQDNLLLYTLHPCKGHENLLKGFKGQDDVQLLDLEVSEPETITSAENPSGEAESSNSPSGSIPGTTVVVTENDDVSSGLTSHQTLSNPTANLVLSSALQQTAITAESCSRQNEKPAIVASHPGEKIEKQLDYSKESEGSNESPDKEDKRYRCWLGLDELNDLYYESVEIIRNKGRMTKNYKTPRPKIKKVVQLYKPVLKSICINGIDIPDPNLSTPCLTAFFRSNPQLENFEISWNGFNSDLLGLLGRGCPNLKSVGFNECDMLLSDPLNDFFFNCKHLEKVNLQGVCYIMDRALVSLIANKKLKRLNLSECNITDVSMDSLAVTLNSQLLELDLSWCDHIGPDGMENVVQLCTNLQTLSLRQCAVSTRILDMIPQYLVNLKRVNLSGVNTLSDRVLIAMALNLSALEFLDVGWNMELTDASISAVMLNCNNLVEFVINGLKRITSQPFAPLISDLNRWKRSQALLKFKYKESQVFSKNEHYSSDEEFEELYVAHRSTSFAPSLRILEVEYCDKINDDLMAELVAVCRGTLEVRDYYGARIRPRYITCVNGKFIQTRDFLA